ncbi:MAG: response regulator transcription factor [Anaerolineales bacterium]|nr:response regulator transcription factor [Anaerolineales bacterium]
MKAKDASQQKVRVAVLEDHHTTIDGYTYRLSMYPNIELVATARNGEQLIQMLAEHQIDVLILDVVAPAAEGTSAPYPLFNVLPNLRKQYPHMAVLVISGHRQPTLIRAVVDAGARGYIVKTDAAASQHLGEIITSLASGGMYLSEQTVEALAKQPGGSEDIDMLTERQREVLSMCAAHPGMPTDALAAKLNIASSTVRNLLSSSYKRLRVNNMTAAILKARELGLITPLDDVYKL